jgi:hypothetical protein
MPQKTVELLDSLEPLGFDDDAFRIIHHFPEDRHPSIKVHREYCCGLSTGLFRTRTNDLVRKRLQIIMDSFEGGKFSNRAVFVKLAEAAVLEIPKDN